ncbi:AAA family ATPase [Acinetobacter sp. NRRL B-65365]|uniref:ATP-binding protein n=1 Tax=Acinetobacter sp. NRRL B-65365 TaxID=1785092 RepID=UPI0007A0C229|nr:ATP-binding protein [Acinetobacter sp. NRRL B-65365]KYQ80390.1 AAA family ATPase [Acinetobacter sp. NRRL B-65365]
MAILDLPESIIQSLSNVLTQLQQVLPAPKQPTDFSAIAFRWENQQLVAIQQPKKMYLEDLKGIERQKDKIIQNTLQFLNGLPANDVLLTGSRGTGKSSIVRALLTEYSAQGLRLIEIERDDLSDLPKIQKLIENRPEKFIVYCDDLAFNAEDENYRSLKSVLDGSLQSGSSNFIIYATSNRRHLLPEFMHENTPVQKVDVPQYTELHPQEAIEEKISLSDRFGMWLSFYPMDQQLYLQIVEHYIVKANLEYNDLVRSESLKWCQARGQRSGRAAYQFSKHWIGSQNLEKLSNKASA